MVSLTSSCFPCFCGYDSIYFKKSLFTHDFVCVQLISGKLIISLYCKITCQHPDYLIYSGESEFVPRTYSRSSTLHHHILTTPNLLYCGNSLIFNAQSSHELQSQTTKPLTAKKLQTITLHRGMAFHSILKRKGFGILFDFVNFLNIFFEFY